ncbi:HIT domain-containing protein [Candidatus Nomurabacteria bacterium]|nr:HIT domain-containing protein [Candidatus Nomurabacteria bacterium]
MKDCVFCDITKREEVIFEDESSVIFRPLKPVVEGHVLIIQFSR